MFLTRNLRVEICGTMLQAPQFSFSRMLETPPETPVSVPASAPVVTQRAWINPLEEPARPAHSYYRTVPIIPSSSIGPSSSLPTNTPNQ
jgi:hypothetical protein